MIDGVFILWCGYIIGGYLIGGVMFCRLIPKTLLNVDVCELSPDHNPGATNVFAHCGTAIGLLCLFLDMLKGFWPVYSACRTLGTDNILFAAVMAAPVLGHAMSPFDRAHGGKCIATSFGETLAILPVTNVGLILAGLYILFSTVIKIESHRKRSIAAFSCFGVLSGIILFYIGKYYVALGCVCISCVAVAKHMKRFLPADQNIAENESAGVK